VINQLLAELFVILLAAAMTYSEPVGAYSAPTEFCASSNVGEVTKIYFNDGYFGYYCTYACDDSNVWNLIDVLQCSNASDCCANG
jgi:hypothetical protein